MDPIITGGGLALHMEIDLEVLVSPEEIQERTRQLGAQIAADYAEQDDLVVVGVLKGSVLFMADLVRRIDLPLTCDFLRVSSYGEALESSGVVRFELDLSQPVKDKHVLVVEDIIDTGLTMHYLLDNLRTRHPASLKIATLLDKPSRRKKTFPIDYIGFTIPNRFVVGYGLDYKGRYRNLPYVGALREGAEGLAEEDPEPGESAGGGGVEEAGT